MAVQIRVSGAAKLRQMKSPDIIMGADMSEDFNMTMRKFLKQVGVTSQQAIEDAMREAGVEATAGQQYAAKIVLTVDGLAVTHEVTGTIAGRSA